MNRKEFVSYLQETLIPDLRESGSDATVDDFKTAISMIDIPPDGMEAVEIIPNRYIVFEEGKLKYYIENTDLFWCIYLIGKTNHFDKHQNLSILLKNHNITLR